MTKQIHKTSRAKPDKKSSKRGHYDKPLSLHPLSLEEAVTVMLHTPPMKNSKRKKERKAKASSKA